MMSLNDSRLKVAHNLLVNSGCAKIGEKILVVTDAVTKDIGNFIISYCNDNNLSAQHHSIGALKIHGAEPPQEIAELMLQSDLILGLTQFSMAHTEARKSATEKGVRYLSLPDYDWEVFDSEALLVDFNMQRDLAKKIAQLLDSGKKVRITTTLGTDINFVIDGRKANNCDAVLDKPSSLGSPPDIEVNVAPLEYETEGLLVVDGSVPHPDLGILSTPFYMELSKGVTTKLSSKDSVKLSALEGLFEKYGEKARIIGELGFGLNPIAKLTGRMLEDEGIMGSIHCGFGSNSTIGGSNKVSFHLDFIVMKPSVEIDGVLIMKDGEYVF